MPSSPGHGVGPVPVRRRVQQGDPLSGILFNCVIDWALSSLQAGIGFPLAKKIQVTHLAFTVLQPLRWRCIECAIHHERDVREE